MATVQARQSEIDLAPYRRRILLLRAWRRGAAGGCAGAVLAIIALVADRYEIIDAEPLSLLAVIVAAIVVGAASAWLERYSDAAVARSVDRRSNLEDRLTTSFEACGEGGAFEAAVRKDAARRIGAVSARDIYPVTLSRSHLALGILAAVCALFYGLSDTALFRSAADRAQAAALRHAGQQVQAIAKPALENARQPGAGAADRKLARDLERFARDLSKARLNRQEALVRANDLADRAEQLEAKHSDAMAQAAVQAQTAGQRLQEMAGISRMEKAGPANAQPDAAALERQLQAARSQLDLARAGKSDLNSAQQKAIEQKLAQLSKQLDQIRLSAQDMAALNKLLSLPDFKEALDILSRLAAQARAQQQGLPPQLSEAQVKAMAAQLEALAKRLNSQAAMRDFAKSLLALARQARLGQCHCSGGLLGAFGLCANPLASLMKGPGLPGPGVWLGGLGQLSKSDKSSLLHIKFQDREITSQKGKDGQETYTEQSGPAQLGAPAAIPYQAILPKYERTAETALRKGDIPAPMRTQVHDYFESLHQ